MQDKELLIINYFENSEPAAWHAVLRAYDYGKKAKVIAWLKDNPRTEKGTALMIYWMMRPKFSKQYPIEEVREKEITAFGESYYDLIEDIEQKYLAGFYTSEKIGYNPFYDYSKESISIIEKRPIPMKMYLSVGMMEFDFAAYDRDHSLTKGLPNDLYLQLTQKIEEEPEFDPEIQLEENIDNAEILIEESIQRLHKIVEESKQRLNEIVEEFSETEEDKIILDYLKTVDDPIVWHLVIVNNHLIYLKKTFAWLINNPKTEKATALYIYWYMDPVFLKQFNSEEESAESELEETDEVYFNLLHDLEQKYLSGFYANNIGTDYNVDGLDFDELGELEKSGKVPPQMCRVVQGQHFDFESYEAAHNLKGGLSAEVYDRTVEERYRPIQQNKVFSNKPLIILWITILIFIFSIILIISKSCSRRSHSYSLETEEAYTEPEPEGYETLPELKKRILTMKAEDIGLSSADTNQVIAILFDLNQKVSKTRSLTIKETCVYTADNQVGCMEADISCISDRMMYTAMLVFPA